MSIAALTSGRLRAAPVTRNILRFARGLFRLGLRTTAVATSWRLATADFSAAPAEVAAAFPREAFEATLDKLVHVACAAGAAEERRRIAALIEHPKAKGRAGFAWRLATTDGITSEQAVEALELLEIDEAFVAAAEAGEPITLQ
jgi:hypothetical protein